MTNLLSLLARLTTVRIDKFAASGEVMPDSDDRTPAGIHEGANAVCSRFEGCATATHAIAIDLDVPAFLVPSSTPGHSHLYIDHPIGEADYYALLDLLAKVGVLEANYVTASKNKGGTHLRLPWVKKEPRPVPTATSPIDLKDS